ncbi:hypothetical protein AX17_006984 [Amanita inopinata Kibby_2008]|nr:hypothetical protein AX17_006984 [Amanita inopinata Kibby_2008]
MTPAFKAFRGILHSVRNTVMEATVHNEPDPLIDRIVSHQHASSWADVAFSNLMKCGDGQGLLHQLMNDYRVSKFYTYKKRWGSQHEFTVVEITHNDGKPNVLLRIERSIGPKSKSKSKSSPQSSAGSGSDSKESLDNPSTKSSDEGSRSSSSSIGSAIFYPERFIELCRCFISNIKSSSFWARDTIVRLDKLPKEDHANKVRTVEYNCSPSQLPSLWDLVHVVQFVNQKCDKYSLFDAQCYWYADTVSGILESWCAPEEVRITRPSILDKKFPYPSPGTNLHIVVHTRDEKMIAESKVTLMAAIKASYESVMEFLEPKRAAEEKIKGIQANADARVESLSRQLREADTRVKDMSRQLKESDARVKDVEARSEARVKDVEARAEVRVKDMSRQLKAESEARVKDVEARAEVRVKDMSRQLKAESEARVKDVEARSEVRVKDVEARSEARVKEVEARAEVRLKEAETRIHDMSKQMQQAETRANARDEILAQIMAHLEDHRKPNGHSIILAGPRAT